MFPVPLPFPYRTPVPRSWERWTRKVRVGANSPSLWPTIDSLMYTGTCLRPSCTAMVWPTMSGMIVERRDQVLITRLSRLRFRSSIFFSKWSSTKGPFFRERPIGYLPLPLPRRRRIILSESLLRRRVRPSGLPHGLTGWRPPELLPSPPPSGWSTGFMATPRVCGRRSLCRLRPALPQLIRSCSELPTSPTVARQVTSTWRISPEGIRRVARPPSLASSWMATPAERPILAPPPGRSSTAWTKVPTGMLRNGEAVRRQDVALLAVEVVEQRDPGGPVRVVLDRRHLGRHPVLVAAEVDDAVALLVATAAVPRGDAAVHVAPAGLRGGPQQRLLRRRLRHLDEVGPGGAAPPRRSWLVIADTH